MTRIALVAGEASGDQLGAGLIAAARRIQPDLEFVGIAGPAMRAAGCEAWFAAEELSVMGLAEVVRHLPRIARLKRELTRRLLARRPAVYVGIDAPDFNLRVASALHSAGIPTVQYVCPSVWAWRQGRIAVLRDRLDRTLCLLPFEAPFLEAHGAQATFVGHPFANEITGVADKGAARAALGLDARAVVGILPGSRQGEVTRLGPDFLRAARLLWEENPAIAFVAAMATSEARRLFERQAAGLPPGIELRLVDGRAREVIAASDVVLLASGTVTLEAMLVGRPMVVAYRFSPATYWAARLLRLIRVRHFALPNLLAGEALVPEFLQGAVTPANLARAVGGLLSSPGDCERLRARFAAIHSAMRGDSSGAAARAVLEVARLGGPARRDRSSL